MYDTEKIKNHVKSILNEKRFTHSMLVAETAMKMAAIFGVNVIKAEIAGLLHDCAKDFKVTEFMELLSKDEEIKKEDYDFPEILHGFAGAMYARNVFRVEDKEILNAIRYHTVGRKRMSILDMIVYLADWIEPSRCCEPIEKIRKVVFEEKNLKKAMLMASENEIKHLLEKGRPIHHNTIDMRNTIIYSERLRK